MNSTIQPTVTPTPVDVVTTIAHRFLVNLGELEVPAAPKTFGQRVSERLHGAPETDTWQQGRQKVFTENALFEVVARHRTELSVHFAGNLELEVAVRRVGRHRDASSLRVAQLLRSSGDLNTEAMQWNAAAGQVADELRAIARALAL